MKNGTNTFPKNLEFSGFSGHVDNVDKSGKPTESGIKISTARFYIKIAKNCGYCG
jgi:hypothetical protein